MERPLRARPAQEATPTEDRRRHRRVEVAWDATVESIRRLEWPGEIVSFGPYGMRIRLETKEPAPSEGAVIRLKFAPPAEPFLSIEGIVSRVDPGSVAITFINVNSYTSHRLKTLLDRLLEESV